jgi:hypothetical protein
VGDQVRALVARPLGATAVQGRDGAAVQQDAVILGARRRHGGQARAAKRARRDQPAGLGPAVAGLRRLAAHGAEHAGRRFALAAQVVARVLRPAIASVFDLADAQTPADFRAGTDAQQVLAGPTGHPRHIDPDLETRKLGHGLIIRAFLGPGQGGLDVAAF